MSFIRTGPPRAISSDQLKINTYISANIPSKSIHLHSRVITVLWIWSERALQRFTFWKLGSQCDDVAGGGLVEGSTLGRDYFRSQGMSELREYVRW